MSTTKALPTSMPAWQLKVTGPLEQNLVLNEVAPVPALKANQSLIKILTTGLNPVDYKILEFPYLGPLIVSRPATPGIDFVGRVWEPSSELTAKGIKAGDLVFGKHGGPVKFGTLAKFSIVDGTEGIVKVPAGFEHDRLPELSGVGVAAQTAYQSIADYFGDDLSGKAVFINGGSGGTGIFGLQIAKKCLNADVLVTSCSTPNVDLCKQMGADVVIDYRKEKVVDGLKKWVSANNGRKFDHVIDNVGNIDELYWPSAEYLKQGGVYGLVGGSPNLSMLTKVLKVFLWPGVLGGGKRKITFVALKTKAEAMEKIAKWMAEDKIKGLIDETFAFEDAKEAFGKLKTGRAKGKIVVKVSEDGVN